jgi:hypothetical protein
MASHADAALKPFLGVFETTLRPARGPPLLKWSSTMGSTTISEERSTVAPSPPAPLYRRPSRSRATRGCPAASVPQRNPRRAGAAQIAQLVEDARPARATMPS